MLKIGIVGGGHIVRHRHIPIFKKINGVEVFAVCDKVESVARSVAKEFGVKHYFTRLSDMLQADVDVVDVCTPPMTHYPLIVEALEAGCHVLAEKPLGMTIKEVDEMYRIAERNNVKLCVVHQNLFNPAFQRAFRMVKEGVVGDVLGVDVGTYIRRDNYMCVNKDHWCHKLPGGIFFEILPHPVYLLQTFLKNVEPVGVLAEHLGSYSWMKVDELKVLVKGANGVGSIVASCNSPFHGDSLYVFGSKMCLQVDLWGRYVIKYRQRTEEPLSVGKHNLSLSSQFFSLIGATISNSFTVIFSGEKVSAHYGFLKAFVEALENNGEMPVSEEEAKENVRVVEAICQRVDEIAS
ncbi:MAG: Gfo/Idh/MocA family oxidoreductase [Candidatus Bathyarchaeia archaeon]